MNDRVTPGMSTGAGRTWARRARWRAARAASVVLGLALLVASGIGCRGGGGEQEAPPSTAESGGLWLGALADLLDDAALGWVYVGVDDLRGSELGRGVLEAVSGQSVDPLTGVFVEADELLVAVWELDPDERLSVVRVRQDALGRLAASLNAGAIPGTSVRVEVVPGAARPLWRSPSNGWALATPADNLLLVGPEALVTRTLARFEAHDGSPGPQAGAPVIFSMRVTHPMQQQLASLFERPVIIRQIEAMERISGAMAFQDGLHVTVRADMPYGGNPNMAATMVRMGLSRYVPGLLEEIFRPEYAAHLIEQTTVTATDEPGRRGVLLRWVMPAAEAETWLAMLAELASEPEVPARAPGGVGVTDDVAVDDGAVGDGAADGGAADGGAADDGAGARAQDAPAGCGADGAEVCP